jgi:hypothetical protein
MLTPSTAVRQERESAVSGDSSISSWKFGSWLYLPAAGRLTSGGSPSPLQLSL